MRAHHKHKSADGSNRQKTRNRKRKAKHRARDPFVDRTKAISGLLVALGILAPGCAQIIEELQAYVQ